ncbi:APX5 [Symbiodinium sp. KB8]|nr:APX5 [Symbiodinium sp. KB8]
MMACPGGATLTTECMTEAQYDELLAAVRGHLESLPETCTASNCPQADWAGCVLRMAGHDFMDFANGQGGSDACTDMSDPDNGGLPACLSSGEHGISLVEVYQNYCATVSLADFLVIAAEAVMMSTRARHLAQASSAPALDLKSSFRFGRTTALSCAFAEGRLPNPERGCTAVEETFVDSMGLTWTEAAALMAVHTLGRAQVSNSGYHGWWSDPENSRRFNNDYFVSLLAKGWVPERAISGNAAKNQWERSDVGRDTSFDGHEMMLNTDMCLVYSEPGPDGGPVLADVHDCCGWLTAQTIAGAVASNGGEYCGGQPPEPRQERQRCCGPQQGDCGRRDDPRGPAAQAVLNFAADETAWLEAFTRAWTKAVENGQTNLKSLGDCSAAPTSSTFTSGSPSNTATTSAEPDVSDTATTSTTPDAVTTQSTSGETHVQDKVSSFGVASFQHAKQDTLAIQGVTQDWYTANMSPATAGLATSLFRRLGLAQSAPADLSLNVLETHCGDALAASELLPLPCVASYTACDFSEGMLSCAEERLGGRGKCVVGDSTALPFESASFDRYVSNLGCCCTSDLTAKLSEARRVLKPGGLAAMSMRIAEQEGDTSFALTARTLKPFGYPPQPDREGLRIGLDLELLRERLRAAGFEDVSAWRSWVSVPLQTLDDFMQWNLGDLAFCFGR